MKTWNPIEKLTAERNLSDEELRALLQSDALDAELFRAADKRRREIYDRVKYIV